MSRPHRCLCSLGRIGDAAGGLVFHVKPACACVFFGDIRRINRRSERYRTWSSVVSRFHVKHVSVHLSAHLLVVVIGDG